MNRPKQVRRGAMAILLAVMLITLFAFLAFAIDLGNVYVVRSQLQSAADSAALAAVQRLAEDQTNQVRAAAVDFAKQNEPNNGDVLVNGDVTLGVWSNSSRTFTATSSSPNAVKVVVRRDGTNTAGVATSFARLFGVNSTNVTATSIAMYQTSGSNKTYSFVE